MRPKSLHTYYVTFSYTYMGRALALPYAIDAEDREKAEEKAREVFTVRQMPECEIGAVKVELLYL
jgi:1,2-phenylacetyl-CoA epoxidase PaaB subunit